MNRWWHELTREAAVSLRVETPSVSVFCAFVSKRWTDSSRGRIDVWPH